MGGWGPSHEYDLHHVLRREQKRSQKLSENRQNDPNRPTHPPDNPDSLSVLTLSLGVCIHVHMLWILTGADGEMLHSAGNFTASFEYSAYFGVSLGYAGDVNGQTLNTSPYSSQQL